METQILRLFKENIYLFPIMMNITIDDKYPEDGIKRRERKRERKIKLPSFNQTNNGRVS